MPQTSPYAAVLTELEPVVAENLDRHIRMAKEWHPHDYVPWDEGRNFAFLGGEDWSPEQSRLDETAKAAMIFYRNLVTAAFDINPDEMMKAVANEVIHFEMPGANMANFRKNSIIIAKAGIYDPRLHYDEVVSPILRTWKVFERTDFGPEGEKAREELAQFLTGLDEQATKFVDNRERMRARIAARGDVPIHV